MKPVDVKPNAYIDFIKEDSKKILKYVILLEYQNRKVFMEKVTLQIGLKKFL